MSKTASESRDSSKRRPEETRGNAEWLCLHLLEKKTQMGFCKKMTARSFLGLTALRAAGIIDSNFQGSLQV